MGYRFAHVVPSMWGHSSLVKIERWPWWSSSKGAGVKVPSHQMWFYCAFQALARYLRDSSWWQYFRVGAIHNQCSRSSSDQVFGLNWVTLFPEFYMKILYALWVTVTIIIWDIAFKFHWLLYICRWCWLRLLLMETDWWNWYVRHHGYLWCNAKNAPL